MLSKMFSPPLSCDTFVVMPPLTSTSGVIFGKNSDRPQLEVQEVVYIKGSTRPEKLKCTYITIEESRDSVNDVILSKPAWMWGAEMGANQWGVCIGNEAVWTNHNDGDGDARHRRLLGMDLVRLGLERSNTAEGALEVITSLLEKYGQGGPCSWNDDSNIYHNSFIIADPHEAWVLETSGKLWAAEKVDTGYRNISNCLSITTKIDKHSKRLKEKAQALGLWNGEGEFNFSECFSSGGDNQRQREGEKLLQKFTNSSAFTVKDMFAVLRDKKSGICRGCEDLFPTQGSQVSCLNDALPCVHWFTATPDPSRSVFKPFVFTPNAKISEHTVSPSQKACEDLQHSLYKLHARQNGSPEQEHVRKLLWGMEGRCIGEVSEFLEKYRVGECKLDELSDLMKDCVETEINFYR